MVRDRVRDRVSNGQGQAQVRQVRELSGTGSWNGQGQVQAKIRENWQ